MGKILVLDDDEDLLSTLADVLQNVYARDCVSVHSVEELKRSAPAIQGCDMAILDVNLGANQPSGLDAFHWLERQHFPGRVVFVTGHAESHPLVAEAQRLSGSHILRKPFVIEELGRVLSP